MTLNGSGLNSSGLPFPTPPAVKDLLDELVRHEFTPRCELMSDGSITVSITTDRVYASGTFRRKRGGYTLVKGILLVDGLVCPTASCIADLRAIVDDPDGHLAKRVVVKPPPHVQRLTAGGQGPKDDMTVFRVK